MEKKISKVESVEHLLSELKYLRTILKEAGEAFILRTEGKIETLSGYLAGMSPKESRQIGRTWLREVHGTSFKPAKGRFKDLKKIDDLLEDLSDTIIESQSIPEKPPRIRNKSKMEDKLPDLQSDLS
jgi:hypothetical protein